MANVTVDTEVLAALFAKMTGAVPAPAPVAAPFTVPFTVAPRGTKKGGRPSKVAEIEALIAISGLDSAAAEKLRNALAHGKGVSERPDWASAKLNIVAKLGEKTVLAVQRAPNLPEFLSARMFVLTDTGLVPKRQGCTIKVSEITAFAAMLAEEQNPYSALFLRSSGLGGLAPEVKTSLIEALNALSA